MRKGKIGVKETKEQTYLHEEINLNQSFIPFIVQKKNSSSYKLTSESLSPPM